MARVEALFRRTRAATPAVGSNLRKKLEPDPRSPRFIKTVRGIGYRMGDGAPS